MTFRNAPLIEIIAELRWVPGPPAHEPSLTTNSPNILPLPEGGRQDEFFMHFGGEVYQHDFQRSERVVPPAFPYMRHQVVFRYRRKSGSELFQIGAGLFTANAVPPYRSWIEFEPEVTKGVDALLKTRDQAECDRPFTAVSLRYIDAFRGLHMSHRAPNDFLRDVLGFSVLLPETLSAQIADGQSPRAAMQISMPLRNSLELNVSVGEGSANNEPALIMDTAVAATEPVPPTTESVMKTLNAAHAVIHDLFVALTKPIHNVLGPEGIES